MKVVLFCLMLALLAVGCSPESTALPLAASSVVDTAPQLVVNSSTLIPTVNLQPTRTSTVRPSRTPSPTLTYTPSFTYTPSPIPTNTPVPTDTPIPTDTPMPTATPTLTHTPTPTETIVPTATWTPTFTWTPSLTATLIPTATFTLPPTRTSIPSPTPRDFNADPVATRPPTWTPPPADASMVVNDHYVMGRPISSNGTNWVDRNYPYGNTRGGQLQIHHGVEFINPQGTPILAAADGVVFYAGSDAETLFGPIYNYYGFLVVIQHNFLDSSGGPVFTLYGHMARTDVAAGQAVAAGQEIGIVGGTGVALGPHLHFEVRVGDPYNFYAVRNPDLWIRPYGGYGTLAGRVTDLNGNALYNVPFTVEDSRQRRYTFSYASDEVSGDSEFRENFTLGDLPSDWYTVTVGEGGRVRFREYIFIYPNRTTWLNVVLQ